MIYKNDPFRKFENFNQPQIDPKKIVRPELEKLSKIIENMIDKSQKTEGLQEMKNSGFKPVSAEESKCFFENSEKNYKFTIFLVGHNSKTVNIEVIGNFLTVTTKKSETAHHFIEDIDFEIELPKDSITSMIDAHMEDGILYITIEKNIPQKAKPQKIEVR